MIRACYKANVDYVEPRCSELELKKADLNGLIASDPQVYVHEAEAGVKQALGAWRPRPSLAIDLCTIRPSRPAPSSA